MQFQASIEEVKRAQAPHNLFISGLFLFNLLMTPAIIALKVGLIGVLIPLFCSGALLGYIYLRSRRTTSWFVDAHWRLSFRHGKWLMLGYAISASLILLAWLLSLTAHEASMKHIMLTALTRIAVIPTLIAVMVTLVLEFGAAAQAVKSEVPDGMVAKFPPPAA
ncbi:MAG TPA: hypothetical protein VFW59_10090 [Gallionella sp.]|nr:hypothetical protein [Gallionella sp.]